MADGSGAAGLPSSNRGVSGFRDGTWTGLDWVAFSVDVEKLLEVSGHQDQDGDLLGSLEDPGQAWFAASIARYFFFDGCDLALDEEGRKGKFYRNRFNLRDSTGEVAGMVEVGGEYTRRKDGAATMRVELTGAGCTAYEGRDLQAGSAHAERWVLLRAKLESVDGRLARVDIAHDDHAGVHSVEEAKQLWEAGEFDNRGQRPKAQLIDDLGNNTGKTLYVGSRLSEKMLRVYEKDKQLGDKQGTRVRWEVEYHASSRKPIDLDILRDPESFFRGSYPVLDFIGSCLRRFASIEADRAACMKSLFRHVRRQYGKAFNFLASYLEHDDEAIGRFVVSLRRPGLPAWAKHHLGADPASVKLTLANV